MTWACSSRSTAAGVPVATPADGPPAPPTTVGITPEAPASPPAPPTIRLETGPDDCALVAAPGEPVATVALTDRIDPSNAPHPSNESERLLFRQLYETLARADCMGRLVPGLAASWRLDGDGRTWIVTLREGARFSDGTPVTAADVRASWTRDSIGGELQPHVSRLVESIVASDDQTLAIRLRSQRVDMPLALAHPDLAVAKDVADSRWPIGTRSARIAPDGNVPSASASSAITIARDNLPPIRFLVAPGDPRDLLDKGVDLLLTRDPAALDYAATLPQFQSVPLAWQRTHVLLAPGRSRSSPSLSEEARQVLADDAVRGEARGAQGPFWWTDGDGLRVSHSLRRETTSSSHATNRLRRERRRGTRSGRALCGPGPRVRPGRGGVPRRAASRPSATDLPARHGVDRRGSGSGTAAGNRCRLHHVDRQSSARSRAGICRS